MTDDMKLQAAYETIDDLRSLKVEQGRYIAKLERQLRRALESNTILSDQLAATEECLEKQTRAYRDSVKPVDAVSRTRIGDPDEHRERCDAYLESVRKARSEEG